MSFLCYSHFYDLAYNCSPFIAKYECCWASKSCPWVGIEIHECSINLLTHDLRLFLALEILDYATLALILQLKMRHILCWNAPLYNPTREKFPSLRIRVAKGALSISFNGTIKLTLASISQRLPHDTTLEN